MNWQQERDLLIAQTMAFVQSVSAKRADRDFLREPPAANAPAANAPAASAPVAKPHVANAPAAKAPAQTSLGGTAWLMAAPPDISAAVRPPARNHGLREEILARVAAFRAHQEVLRRDRDQYCDSVLAKVRTLAKYGTLAPDDPPARR
jgi:hypothetical protein